MIVVGCITPGKQYFSYISWRELVMLWWEEGWSSISSIITQFCFLSTFHQIYIKMDVLFLGLHWIPNITQLSIQAKVYCIVRQTLDETSFFNIYCISRQNLHLDCNIIYSRSGVNPMWILKYSKDLLENYNYKI